MDEELERQLVDDYPEIYRWYDEDPFDHDRPMPQLAVYGFQCGDGWYELLDELSAVVQQEASRAETTVEAHQVKEKFGGLRWYHGGAPKPVLGAVSLAERMSHHICEKCGAAGELYDHRGWLRTRCGDCREPDVE